MNDVHDKTRMFAQVPYDVLDTLKSANAIALYAILKRYAGANGKTHPGRKKLAEDMGFISMKPVDTALDELRKAGLVRTFPRFKDDDGHISYKRDEKHRAQTSNGYVIYDPPTPEVHTPYLSGAYPPTPEVHTPYTSGVHEGDTPEGDTPEGDPPVVPQRGTGQGMGVALIEDPERPASSGYPPAFEAWWADYPKKTGKGDAFRKWKAAKKGIGADELHTRLLDRLPGLLATQQRDPRYVPNPATWLNQGRYDDPVEEAPRPMSQQDQRRAQLVAAAQQLTTPRQEPHYDHLELG